MFSKLTVFLCCGIPVSSSLDVMQPTLDLCTSICQITLILLADHAVLAEVLYFNIDPYLVFLKMYISGEEILLHLEHHDSYSQYLLLLESFHLS